MEVTVSSILLSLVLAALITCARKAANWVWFRPKQIEKCLRDQGFKGNAYRFLYGDYKEHISAIKEANSKPMDANDNNIVPRVLPFYQYFVQGANHFAWVGPTPRLNITDPKLIKEILLNYEVFQKPQTNPLINLIVTGFATYEGEKWATHKYLVNQAFQHAKLKLMLPALYSSCSEMITKWEVLVSTKGSCELDVWPDLCDLTFDMISRTAFGSDYDEGRRIFQLQKEQTAIVVPQLRSIYIPGWRFLPTKTNRKMKKIYNEMKLLVRNIVSKRHQMMNGEGDNDLLGVLLKSSLKTVDQKQKHENIKLTVEEIIAECMLFYLAAQETTSSLIVWTMFLLSKHQKWQSLAREEVLSVIGDDKPHFEGLQQLKTVTMILHEVLRLYSPGPFIIREIHKNTKLGGYVLPAGIEVLVPTILIHHDPEYWGEDAKYFNPERFSEGIAKATKVQGTFLPFGGGPRKCIGQNFALEEAKLTLSMILKRFYIHPSPSYVHAPTVLFTVRPEHGVHLILQKIF
ncbi:hypothetical protein RHMOL_Rhmol06G0001400 [Rhododendron molle]|uniref:Uncharacterized protein n=2 Tax=Rhododendron molle TaxID=49168 RepID=A0ACC0N7R5_RHOML|nr:hypothetical protein RHMOL_Rhmol06G0001400 [Rhododendron molle]KAI8549119.1 hypothetical protein RHMOL_Rhmol06G0001400 [Rhododendron molle]